MSGCQLAFLLDGLDRDNAILRSVDFQFTGSRGLTFTDLVLLLCYVFMPTILELCLLVLFFFCNFFY